MQAFFETYEKIQQPVGQLESFTWSKQTYIEKQEHIIGLLFMNKSRKYRASSMNCLERLRDNYG